MNIISIVNVKGGTGKTTTTINIAGEIAKNKKKVLLIDNDPQSNLSQILKTKNRYNLVDLYTNKKVSFNDCIFKYNDYIYCIPSTLESANIEPELYRKMNRESVLKSKFDNEGLTSYDYVLIDNSPFLGLMVTNSIVMSNYYMVILDNSIHALTGLNMVTHFIEDIKDNGLNQNIECLGILRNRFDLRTIFTKQMSDITEKTIKDRLFKTIIRDSIKYKESAAKNKPIQEYNNKASEPYTNLLHEIDTTLKNS
jgi:chromosome partitioning protein